MSVVAPFWLAIAAAVAIGVVVAHLFSTNVPPREVLPTVRFVPQGAPLAVLRTRRITDVLLLLLRLLAVTLLGLALAGAHVPRRGPVRVVVVDVSRAVESLNAVRSRLFTGDTESADWIVMDSVARVVAASALDTMERSGAKGSLSAGVAAAHRAIAQVSADRDDIELVIVSPIVREEVDSASAALLALWEGPVRLERVAAAEPAALARWEVRAEGDDPVSAALPSSPLSGAVGVQIVRGSPTSQDSSWVREPGHVLVLWPSSASSASSAVTLLERRPATDTVGAIATSAATVVGEFARTHRPHRGRVIARWMDGEPAATEMPLGDGCVREVAIPVDAVGDIALRDSFRALARSFMEPCGGASDFVPVPDSVLLAERRPSADVAGFVPTPVSRLPVWLAIAALTMLVVEQLVRRRRWGART